MSDQNDDPAEDYQCATLVDHDGSRIWISPAPRAGFDSLGEAQRERLLRIMELWCGELSLTKTMFNGNEGRSSGGTMLKAFKGFKHRFYGFERKIDGVRTFVIVDHDPAKKQDKADPHILKRAKGRIDSFGKGN